MTWAFAVVRAHTCAGCVHQNEDEDPRLCDHYALADYQHEEAGIERDPGASDEGIALGQQVSDWRGRAVDYTEEDGAIGSGPCPGREEG